MSTADWDVDASEFRAMAAKLERGTTHAAAGRPVAKAVRGSANAVRRHVRAEMRPHRRTGKMIDKVRNYLTGYGFDTEARVHAGGSVVHLIIGGTAPHELAPVRSRVLAIRGPGRNAPIVAFAGRAHHPGTRPDPVFGRGVDASAPDIRKILSDAIEQMAADLAQRIGRR